MTLLILGLLLWIFSHTFKRILPGARAALGEGPGKGVVALLSLAGILLMIFGYRMTETIPVYTPVPGMGHLNNLLVLIAFYFFAIAGPKAGVVNTIVRHNMLTGLLIWALAHLLVNGDLASIILFGGLAAYSVLSMWLISRAVPWTRPARGPISTDIRALVAGAVLYAVAIGVHMWMGYNLFDGTYQ